MHVCHTAHNALSRQLELLVRYVHRVLRAQQFKQYGYALGGNRLDQAFKAPQTEVAQPHLKTRLEGADGTQIRTISFVLERLDGLELFRFK